MTSSRSPHLITIERRPLAFVQQSWATASLLTTMFLSTKNPSLAHWLQCLGIYIIYSHSYIKQVSLTLSNLPLCNKKDFKPGEMKNFQRSHKSKKLKPNVISVKYSKTIKISQYAAYMAWLTMYLFNSESCFYFSMLFSPIAFQPQ